MQKLNKNELCYVSKTHSKYIANKKNYLLNPQVKVMTQVKGSMNTSPGKGVAEYEMPICFQASVTTSQDNFFKIP